MKFVVFVVLVFFSFAPAAMAMHPHSVHEWADREKVVINSLSLDSLGPPPGDPSNRVADLAAAVFLGRRLFFDKRFSGNLEVSCATCHRPDYDFTDPLPLAHGMGTTRRRTMPLAGVAYSPFLFWDGRKDSLWAQALGPIESRVEHGFNRSRCYLLLKKHFRAEYESIFGPMPEVIGVDPGAWPAEDGSVEKQNWESLPSEARTLISRVYANMGKAIAAFVRRITPGMSRFDRYARAVTGREGEPAEIFTDQEAGGLRLFISKAGCVNCHNGPLFTNYDFHDLAIPRDISSAPDSGRAEGIAMVLADEFNCRSPYSDAPYDQCFALRFMDPDPQPFAGAFKTPSLRNVAARPPYMHAGQFATLRRVIEHYRTAAAAGRLKAEFSHGGLSDDEIDALIAFLKTLSAAPLAPQ